MATAKAKNVTKGKENDPDAFLKSLTVTLNYYLAFQLVFTESDFSDDTQFYSALTISHFAARELLAIQKVTEVLKAPSSLLRPF